MIQRIPRRFCKRAIAAALNLVLTFDALWPGGTAFAVGPDAPQVRKVELRRPAAAARDAGHEPQGAGSAAPGSADLHFSADVLAGGQTASLLPLNPGIIYDGTWRLEDRNNSQKDDPAIRRLRDMMSSAVEAPARSPKSLGQKVAEAVIRWTRDPRIEGIAGGGNGRPGTAQERLGALMDGSRPPAPSAFPEDALSDADAPADRHDIKTHIKEALKPGAAAPGNTLRLSAALARAREKRKAVHIVDTSYATKDEKYARLPWLPYELPVRTAMSHAFNVILGNRDIEAHAFVITPAVLPTWYLRHALSLLPPEDARLVAERLHTVALPGLPVDIYPGNIAWRVLRSGMRDEVVARIKAGIAEFGDVPLIYESYNVVRENSDLADLLGAPTFSAPRELAFAGTKSGFLLFLAQDHVQQALSQVRLADGEARVTANIGFNENLHQLVTSIYRLYRKGAAKVWIKTETGVSGMGNGIYLTPKAYFLPQSVRRILGLIPGVKARYFSRPEIQRGATKKEVMAAIEASLPTTAFADESMTWRKFLELLTHGGVSVEEHYPGAEYMIASPSAGVTITDRGPDPTVHIQEQLLEGAGLFTGMKSPASAGVRGSVAQVLMAVARKLHALGTRGTIGLDFMVIPHHRWQYWLYRLFGIKMGKFSYYIVEHNQREIGSTPARAFAKALTGAKDDPEGMLRLNGHTVAYLMTVDPTDQDPRLMEPGIQYKLVNFIEGPGGQGWAFNRKSREGAWLYMPDSIEHAGYIHAVAIAHAAREKDAVARRTELVNLQQTAIGELFHAQQRTGAFKNYSVQQWIEEENISYAKMGPRADMRPALVRRIVEERRERAAAAFIAHANERGLNAQAAVLAVFERYLLEQGVEPGEVIPLLKGGYLLLGDEPTRRANQRLLRRIQSELTARERDDFDAFVADLTQRLRRLPQRPSSG